MESLFHASGINIVLKVNETSKNKLNKKKRPDWWLPEAVVGEGGIGWEWSKGTNSSYKISSRDVKYKWVTRVTNIVLYIWKVLRVSF